MQKLEIDGIAFDVVGARRVPSTSRSFGVRKTPWMIDRYKELAGEFSEANVIELGIDQGSSTAMFALPSAKPSSAPILKLPASRRVFAGMVVSFSRTASANTSHQVHR